MPPKDNDGNVQPHDDYQTLPNDAWVVRKVQRRWIVSSDNGPRLSKGCFSGTSKDRDPYEGMSVEMLDRLLADELSARDRLDPDHVGAVALRVGDLRALGLKVGPDPGKAGDPYHANVWGVTKKIRKAILRVSVWHIGPML